MTAVLAAQKSCYLGGDGRERLMIAGIDEPRAVRAQAIAERQSRVIEVMRLDLDVADRQRSLDQIMVADGRASCSSVTGK